MLNIWPILWRDLKIELANFTRFIVYFASPILIMLFFSLAFSVHVQQIPYSGRMFPFAQFFLPGLFTLQLFALVTTTFSSVRIDCSNDILGTISLSQTSVVSYYLGKLTAALLITFLRIAILIFIGRVCFGLQLPTLGPNIFAVVAGIFLGATLWFSIGFVLGLHISREELRDLIISTASLPLTFTSSIFYNVDSAPPFIRALSMVNPLTYNCNLIRGGFLNGGIGQLPLDYLVLGTLGAVSVVIAVIDLQRPFT